MSPPQTSLYDLMSCCCWFDSKFVSHKKRKGELTNHSLQDSLIDLDRHVM